MNVRSLSTPILGIGLLLGLGVAASAQDASQTPVGTPAHPQNGVDSGQNRGSGRGWGGGGGMGPGRGTMGTVTEVAPDHYTIKTEAGETYTVHYSVNTRILKQQARPAGERGGRGQDGGQGDGTRGQARGDGGGGNPPQAIKASDIKVGDAIAAMGEVDAAAKSVGAVMVMQIDPERAKQMREMQANYGKTWIMGKVTAIDGVKVTLMGTIDNAPHSFVADENTTFRKRREPITLGDIQVGDMVRAEGGVKEGAFLATAVNAMSPPPAGATVPRQGPAAAPPQ
jgi:hypothetical protein